jgi:hypothetical protein
MNITIYTEDSRLGTAEIPPFIVGDSTAWTLLFQNSAGEFYSPAAVTVKLGHINGLADGSYPSAFKWVDRCRNEHVASIVVAAGVPTLTWANPQPVGGMVGVDGVYIVRGQIPDGRITGVVPSDETIELTREKQPPKSPSNFTFSTDAGGAGATGRLFWELKKYILRITITNGGTGYTSAPTVVFTGGGGDRAKAIATISDCGSVVDIKVTDNGCSYTSAPTISFTAIGPGSGAAAICEWVDSDGSSGITSIEVKTAGTGYTSAPTIAITDSFSTGSGAEAVGLGWDSLATLVIGSQGTGYSSNPKIAFNASTVTLTIANPGVVSWNSHGRAANDPVMFITTGALPTGVVAGTTYYVSATGLTSDTFQISATAGGASIITTGSQSGVHSGSLVNAAAVITGAGIITRATFIGSGGPSFNQSDEGNASLTIPFNFLGGGGQGATGNAHYVRQATSLLKNLSMPNGGYGNGTTSYSWVLFRVDVTNPGAGYTSNPGATLYGATITGFSTFTATITTPGSGYSSPPSITISGGGGTGMTATATTGRITSISVTNPGQDYTSPIVTITGGSSPQATAVANVDGRRRYGVKYAEILSSGNGYTSTPYVLGNVQVDNRVVTDGITSTPLSATRFIATVQAGIEFSELPYKRAESSPAIMGAVRLSGFSDGRYSGAGQLQYDHSALLVLPRTIATGALTAGTNGDGDPVWSGTLNPINAHVTARLAARRSTTLDLQIFGDGRMLFQGALTILAKIN